MDKIFIILAIFLLILQFVSPKQHKFHCKSDTHDSIIKIKPYIIDYGNGSIIRDPSKPTPYTPPPNNSIVKSKDITFLTKTHFQLRARVIIPAQLPTSKLPILVYFHGGAFCIGSAFDISDTNYLARLVAKARVVALSIEYRLYPEYSIPAAYEDAWDALNWVAAHKNLGAQGLDPWLVQHGDLERVFVGGDSAGGNIAHNVALRAGLSPLPNSVKITGLFLAMPYFLGSKRLPHEPKNMACTPNYKIWSYVCRGCKDGIDNGYINPFGAGAPSLSHLGCKRLLVYVSELDDLRERGRLYYERVMSSGWKGEAKLVEVHGEGHVFHILKPQDPQTAKLIAKFARWLNGFQA